jgi:2-oxoglutarate ferredoxin oxidoreductase subunit alpha
MLNEMSIRIGGEAGQGMESTAAGFAKALSRGGLYVHLQQDFMSRIRGGHNYSQIRVSAKPLHVHSRRIQLLLAFNAETVEMHKHDLVPGGAVIYDSSFAVNIDELKALGLKPMPMPLEKLAKELGGDKLMQNTAAVAATAGITGFPYERVAEVITQNFRRKGDDVVNGNLKVAQAAYDQAVKEFGHEFAWKLSPVKHGPRMMLNGNHAIALGAIAGGVKFISAYPMTPGTSIIEYLTAKANRFGILTKQVEDETAAILMAIGAATAGVRAMTSTSGGGFSLMVEALGMAGITETPLVIVLAQRTGPSTGMPTRTEQADLQFALHASQGEFPRIVLAPGSIEQCFEAGWRAFNLAEKYQLPVLILTDLYQAFTQRTVESDSIDLAKTSIDRGELISAEEAAKLTDYARHAFTESGISPRLLPGISKLPVFTTSDEHSERGYIIESADDRVKMMEKRMRKLDVAVKEMRDPELYGPKDAAVTLVGWGSTYGALCEATDILKKEGHSVNVLHFVDIWPFPADRVSAILEKTQRLVAVEGNFTGQFASFLREQTGRKVDHKILRYDGRPLSPDDIVERVKNEVLAHV